MSLTATSCPKLCTAPLHVDTTPQTVAAQLKYIEGGRRVMSRFDGSCIIRYLLFVSIKQQDHFILGTSVPNEEDRRCQIEVGALHVEIAFEITLSCLGKVGAVESGVSVSSYL